MELGVDRVARPDLDQPGRLVQARVEAVERADRRPAGDHPADVIDAAVARADEALGGGHPPHWAAEVHAARGQRDEVVVLVLGLLVDRGVARAHVGDRVAGLAHPGHEHDHLGDVVVVREVARLADRLPLKRRLVEHGRECEAERRQRERRDRDGPGALRGEVHEAPACDGLALEGARHVPIERVLGLRLFVSIWHVRLPAYGYLKRTSSDSVPTSERGGSSGRAPSPDARYKCHKPFDTQVTSGFETCVTSGPVDGPQQRCATPRRRSGRGPWRVPWHGPVARSHPSRRPWHPPPRRPRRAPRRRLPEPGPPARSGQPARPRRRGRRARPGATGRARTAGRRAAARARGSRAGRGAGSP